LVQLSSQNSAVYVGSLSLQHYRLGLSENKVLKRVIYLETGDIK